MCKAKLTCDDYMVINNDIVTTPHIDSIDENETNSTFDKYKNLKIVISKQRALKKSKFLIFSSFDSTFVEVIPILTSLNIRFEFLKGSGGQVANIVKRYKEQDLDVLLVNMRNYGSGLNLENTTDIIMLHKESNQWSKFGKHN